MPGKQTDRKLSCQREALPAAMRRLCLSGLLILLLLAGCSSQPRLPPSPQTAGSAGQVETSFLVKTALAQLDRPYLYGGHSPQGFDCSGLIYYAYQRSGIGIPRTAREQQRRAEPVPLRELAPGDLLFFRERKQKASHVGLYVGAGRFIHASTSQRAVKLSSLDNPYWKRQLISAGRYRH